MKKLILSINLILLIFISSSCKKENASSSQLSESEAFYKNKIASFLTLTENQVSEKEGVTVIHLSFNSCKEEYEYFQFLDPSLRPVSSAGQSSKSSSGNKVTTTAEPADVPPVGATAFSWYGDNFQFPYSEGYNTYDGTITPSAKLTSSLNPGSIGVSAHIRFCFKFPDSGFGTPFIVENQVLAYGVFFGGAGTMTKQSVTVTPGGAGGNIQGQVQYVVTVTANGVTTKTSGFATVVGYYKILPPVTFTAQNCIVQYSLTATGSL